MPSDDWSGTIDLIIYHAGLEVEPGLEFTTFILELALPIKPRNRAGIMEKSQLSDWWDY